MTNVTAGLKRPPSPHQSNLTEVTDEVSSRAMTNVFIYGGCTSRDAVDHYQDYGLELHSYIARQSLISAFHPARPALWDFDTITSTFQKRMLRWDVAGRLPKHIQDNAEDIDLIVWDLMIERVGVRPVRGGGYVTNNPQTRKQATPGRLGNVIKFGTDEHLELWSAALQEFVSVLKATELYDSVIVNGTPWALLDAHGNKADYPDAGFSPEWFNATVQPYWARIEYHGIPVARVSQHDAIADPDHKWGPAYFHYVTTTYKAQLEAITALR